jgi:O-methyltransferase
MIQLAKRAIRWTVRQLGYELVPYRGAAGLPNDFDPATAALVDRVRPYTMTSPERIYAVCQSTRYLLQAGIPGALVECGVWKGGSMMAAACTLLDCGVTDRELYLFDTFAGMTPPGEWDRSHRGESAQDRLASQPGQDPSNWCRCTLDEVRENMRATGYPASRIHFVPGKVEDTLPAAAPDAISLLRLDTDWYESTRHELLHLFGRLSVGGVLIIDDYGHWEGARRAVDEYLAENRLPLLLNRIDYTGRVAVKWQPAALRGPAPAAPPETLGSPPAP